MSHSSLALTIGFAAEAVREEGPRVQCVAPRAATPFVADALHGAGARPLVTGTSPDALDAARPIPIAYLTLAAAYAATWSAAALTLGATSFHHLEIS